MAQADAAIVTATGALETGSESAIAGHFKRNSFVYIWGSVLLGIGAAYRIYLNTMAFATGTDFYSTDFQTYWMPLLYGEILFIGTLTVGFSIYLWVTRETDASAISAELELSRWWKLLGMFSVMGLWVAGLATNAIESDAAWHQVTIRDTDFTPTHIFIFYFALPALTAMLIPAFIWAHTRIPAYMNKISIPFLCVVIGIFMIMPNYGFNEWGHTFFYAEELFAAPIHYGFVFLGWSLFFLIPLAMQMMSNMSRLIIETTASEEDKKSV